MTKKTQTTEYILNRIRYRVRAAGTHSGRIETKSGYSNVWMLAPDYKTLEELIKAGAKEETRT